MYGYERSYQTGRAVTSWLEFIGWIIVVLGVLIALIGFATGGLIGMAPGNLGGGGEVLVRTFAIVPGALIATSGFISIALAQHTKATFDTSEMTRELLGIVRGEPKQGGRLESPPSMPQVDAYRSAQDADSPSASSPKAEDTASFDETGERVFRGQVIKNIGNKYRVGSAEFSTLGKAKAHIKRSN